ncbi:hypothetical protein LEN26_018729 [Aphanomyces euteiches]|nr:hypothetical protein LEN26_018729 [Aphanomyces euteiches]
MVEAMRDTSSGLERPTSWKLLPPVPTRGQVLRCPNCGVAHPKPELVETYRYCHSCLKILHEGKQLQLGDKMTKLNQLTVVAASFGHPLDALKAINVVEELQACVVVTPTFSQIKIGTGVHLLRELFKRHQDPAPGEPKVLCVRYAVPNYNPELTRHGEIHCQVSADGILTQPLALTFHTDRLPKVWINRAIYGHRHSTTPGLVFDVTERLTGRTDCNGGGDFMSLGVNDDLEQLFGEPCAGMTKTLTVEYEIIGRSGQARQYELNGHLREDIVLANLPVVGPAVFLHRAEYGWSSKDLELKITDLKAKLKLSEQKQQLEEELNGFLAIQTAPQTYKDVLAVLQSRIDQFHVPGSTLSLSPDENLNDLFGDPCPGLPRLLAMEYSLLGYGESRTDDEIIKKGSGQSRNFAIRKGGKLSVQVSAQGHLAKPIAITTHEVFPSLMISRAFFGHPINTLKTFDVTEPIGVLAAKGNTSKCLVIPSSMDLIQAFGDPCRGIRKALTINYQVLGMGGTLVLETTMANRLLATLVLGYPPEKKDSGVDGKMGFSERLAMTTVKTHMTARERMQSSTSQRLRLS